MGDFVIFLAAQLDVFSANLIKFCCLLQKLHCNN